MDGSGVPGLGAKGGGRVWGGKEIHARMHMRRHTTRRPDEQMETDQLLALISLPQRTTWHQWKGAWYM